MTGTLSAAAATSVEVMAHHGLTAVAVLRRLHEHLRDRA